jgi:Phage T4 tail fibre
MILNQSLINKMKTKLLISVFCLGIAYYTAAQWTQSGSIVYYTGGNIGIGTTTPSSRLEVVGGLKISDPNGSGFNLLVNNGYGGIFNSSEEFAYIAKFRGNTVNGAYDALAITGGHNGGKVGIGTTTPSHKLDVNGTIGIGGIGVINTSNNANDIYVNSRVIRNESTVNQDGLYLNYNSNGGNAAHLRFYANGTAERMRIDAATGNVGIGTSSPGVKLTVQGLGGVNTDLSVNGRISTGDGSNFGGIWVAGPAGNMFMGQVSTTSMGWFNNGAWRMITDNNGNVGIGTTTPDAKLTVKGLVHAQEVKIDLNGAVAPDYVFDKAYVLPSLESVKAYIDTNKHLPEVPSAKEMEEKGMNVSEMNLLLLKKVEELTLYVIELKKENEIQNQRLEVQQNRIEQLQK